MATNGELTNANEFTGIAPILQLKLQSHTVTQTHANPPHMAAVNHSQDDKPLVQLIWQQQQQTGVNIPVGCRWRNGQRPQPS